MLKAKHLKELLYTACKPISTKILLQLSRQNLAIPFYHAVSDNELKHIKHLYRVPTTKKFIKDLDFLLKYFTPLPLNELSNFLQNKGAPSKPALLLTFDDGLREFHDIVAPILLEKGVPATCFLNSSFIDNKDLFYRFKASLLVEESNKSPEIASIIKTKAQHLPGSDPKKILLSINYPNRHILDEIADAINYDFNSYLQKTEPFMTSSQIENLIKDGFTFGSHGIDHPKYKEISLSEQINQTKESTEYICNKFLLDYKVFAFPFNAEGVQPLFFEKINNVSFSFGTDGFGKTNYENHTHFNRISLERNNYSAKGIVNTVLLRTLLQPR